MGRGRGRGLANYCNCNTLSLYADDNQQESSVLGNATTVATAKCNDPHAQWFKVHYFGGVH